MNFIRKNEKLRNFVFNKLSKSWAEDKFKRINNFLNKDEKILDLGAGKCALSFILKKEGYNVTSVDVENLSLTDQIEPIIYDGENLPFADNSFDTVLLLTVLHHIPEPEIVLKEALRVADKVIIIEDVYTNPVQKYLTYFTDSLFNFEFIGHPHSNKTDKEWKETFKKLNLSLLYTKKENVLKFYTQALYHLQKNN
ncbi:class I SAM-dependent methyltransferase [Halanaerobium hydrogeniformans]|uniref:Methyltransferase type 11 n=1 Tax=Halanaerobium hydrogeniformans TaxID=656519 RepID=E4RKX2_HALHG|nr:class I SAM-dependent methyltransferase [Halanaerobium hydrogeniformans]ADQ15713.1 Methyltransferase type 11 [Halanaerobium hydrogeniformans]